MSVEYRFLEPQDVLFLRGNQLFGEPGSFGISMLPPWPSVAAGAIRSRMLVDDGVDPMDFARGDSVHPSLGTPDQPGPFLLSTFHLARREAGGGIEFLMPVPADLVVSGDSTEAIKLSKLRPNLLPVHAGKGRIDSSAPLPQLAILAQRERSKSVDGYWLRGRGWRNYLNGQRPEVNDLVHSQDLWSLDLRVGVGLDSLRRSAEDGKLFSVQALAFHSGVGFIVGVRGATPPSTGSLRLGGDGRAANLQDVAVQFPTPDYQALAGSRRCRLVLTSPGIFAGGWLPTGAAQPSDVGSEFNLCGIKARIVSAAVPRAEIVSGWDLSGRNGKGSPKVARRVAPAGSVYWLEDLQATPEQLEAMEVHGLWAESDYDAQRRAEGFNRFSFAAY
jgi:CRISPR-associated protein Cmr3